MGGRRALSAAASRDLPAGRDGNSPFPRRGRASAVPGPGRGRRGGAQVAAAAPQGAGSPGKTGRAPPPSARPAPGSPNSALGAPAFPRPPTHDSPVLRARCPRGSRPPGSPPPRAPQGREYQSPATPPARTGKAGGKDPSRPCPASRPQARGGAWGASGRKGLAEGPRRARGLPWRGSGRTVRRVGCLGRGLRGRGRLLAEPSSLRGDVPRPRPDWASADSNTCVRGTPLTRHPGRGRGFGARRAPRRFPLCRQARQKTGWRGAGPGRGCGRSGTGSPLPGARLSRSLNARGSVFKALHRARNGS